MKIIEIAALSNGAHRNQFGAATVPDGWAVIPDGMEIPDTFPFVTLTVEDGTVTAMTAGTVPEEDEPEASPTVEQRVADLEADVAQLLTRLEALA